MIPSSFDESNDALSKPSDMTADECSALSVWRGNMLAPTSEESPCWNGGNPVHVYSEGVCLKCRAAQVFPVVMSCWKPDAAEIEEIKRTGRIWLVVIGQTMPPVMILGNKPNFPDS